MRYVSRSALGEYHRACNHGCLRRLLVHPLPGRRTSITSPLPHRLDTDLLPCLATRAPAAAAMRQEPVEMFTEPMLSPPVPTMSSTSPPGLTGTPADRIALARPVISSTLSPCMREVSSNGVQHAAEMGLLGQ